MYMQPATAASRYGLPSRYAPGWAALFFSLAALLLPTSALPQTGAIVGSVTDQMTGGPIAQAQVTVVGTNLGTITREDGAFRIANVEPGERQVRVQRIGYRGATRTVNVPADGVANVSFELREAAVALDEIVVTGRATGTARREIGSSVARIDAAALEAAPIASISQMLQARSPGVHILPSGGQPGQGSRILLRGVASLSQRNTPVIYVDGVRMDDSPFRGIRTTGPSWAGFEDINPEDIQNIEIIRGASAATLYGTEAAAGVINITTKRGAEGAPRWRLRSELGTNRTPRSWWNASTSVFSDWYYDNMVGSGTFHNNQLSVQGGTGGFNYYAAGTIRGDSGIEPNSSEDYGSFRTNMQIQARNDLRFGVSAGYTSREIMVPAQGNNQEGMLNNGLIGGSAGNWNPPQNLVNLEMFQRGHRFTGSVNADYAPGERWSHRLTLGGDFFNSDNTEYLPPGVVPRFNGGYAGNYRRVSQNLNVDFGSTFRTPLTDRVRSATSVGFQAFRSESGIQSAYGEDFPFRGLRVVGATSSAFAAGESRSEERMIGVYGEQQVAFADRFFVTVGARADGHSAFGADVDYEIYPKVDASYVVSDHGFWDPDWGSLRVRAAYGTAGMQPTAFAAVRTWAATSGAGGLPAIVPNNVGNPNLRPEVSTELELGFDASLFNDRLGLDFTFYDQQTRDALFNARNIPSQGVLGTQLRNVGHVQNRGAELAVQAGLIVTEGFRWDARANLSGNSNEVRSLSGEAPLEVRWAQHIREGFPIAGFFASNHLIEHDGEVINKQTLCADFPAAQAEGRSVECTDAEEYIGPAHPTRSIQLGSDFSFGRNLTFGFTFDHQGGFFRHDHTLRWLMDPRRDVTEAAAARDGISPGSLSTRCREAPAGSLDEAMCSRNSLLSHGEYVVPADFWKLREVSLGYRLPREWTQRVGFASGMLTVAGRNLWRSMATPSLEPEANLNSQSTLERHAYFDTPIPQRVILGITLEY
jgi:TonB-dependent starch-binding outer membrane protein SusC